MSQHKKNISVKCKILLKNICMIHSYLFLIRYLKFMLKRRTASAGFFSQSGTINYLNNQLYLLTLQDTSYLVYFEIPKYFQELLLLAQ
ncbi:hypothetical protein [Candidatus Tisiphia endosymbiont of Parasteatoda lunata]|uniref:hypothetical protein n=1 Tax=Candidatus Tisiphia endosymbiont of Parasteatoda lunata TaxID=3066275 RepID=UPI00313E8FCD